MKLLGLVEFASKRRTVLDDAEKILVSVVEHAIRQFPAKGWYDRLLDEAVPSLFSRVFLDESGHDSFDISKAEADLHKRLREALDKTKEPDKDTVALLTRAIATATVNAATATAAQADDATLILEWVDMHDKNVRPTHQAANGQRRKIGEPFSVGGALLKFPGDTSAPVEEWANCFPADTEVDGRITSAMRRYYSGEMIEVVTTEGKQLTGTPNHPVLTERGWCPLGELQQGDHLVSYQREVQSSVGHDVNAVPASIGQVFDSLAQMGEPVRVSRLGVNFHGERPQGDVDVVPADSELGSDEVTTADKFVREFFLPAADMQCAVLQSGSTTHQSTVWLLTPPQALVGAASKPSLLLGRQLAHPGKHGSGAISRLDGVSEQKAAHGGSTYAEFACEGILGLPGQVSLDQVAGVTRREWSGHVFNLSTETGAYAANGIVVHNCRCVLRPDLAGNVAEPIAAALDTMPEAPKAKPSVIVALPHPDHPIHQMGTEEKHMTLVYLGPSDQIAPEDLAQMKQETNYVAANSEPYTDNVSGEGTLGPDKAHVLFQDGVGAVAHRDQLLRGPAIGRQAGSVQQHPAFIPHTTIGYPDKQTAAAADPPVDSITYDRLAVWHGDEQTEYPLGGSMTAAVTETPVEEVATVATAPGPVPWFGVLIPTGTENRSGDRRIFAEGSLRNRDLPLPLTWQKIAAQGHDGAVTVGRIDTLRYEDGLAKASGIFLQTPEADEVCGLMAAFGRLGVSIDADDSTFELDDDTGIQTFIDARICSASIVNIPAFPEAYIQFGVETQQGSDGAVAAAVQTAGRGPGWATNPEGTRRLHDYWTVPGEPGFEKVAWGTEGDFNRCRVELGQEIGENSPDKLRFLNQICAQWQFDAIGVWPGKGEKLAVEGTPAVAVSLVAAGGSDSFRPPAAWFDDPQLTELTHLQMETHGDQTRIFGHLADWTTCHTGVPGVCTTTPHSRTNYAHFQGRGASVLTGDGPVGVGNLTFGTGHASRTLSMRGSIEHYDRTGSVVADVRVGEDAHGIWFTGWLRNDLPDSTVRAFRAATFSGDWRGPDNEHLEMCAALAVNVPGFPIIAASTRVVDGHQVALVAAGVVHPDSGHGSDDAFVDSLVEKIAAGLESRAERVIRHAALRDRVVQDRKGRIAASVARVNGDV